MMGLFARLRDAVVSRDSILSLGPVAQERRSIEDPNVPISALQLAELLEGPPTLSGVRISADTAMRISAVYACVRVLSEDIASLPVHVYQEKKSGTKERAEDHRLEWILYSEPNEESTSFTFRESMQAQVSLLGNAYAPIDFDGAGRTRSLSVAEPYCVTCERDKMTGELVYWRRSADGRMEKYDRSEILHLPGLGFDGVQGRSVIGFARETMGLTAASEKSAAAFMGNGLKPAGHLTHPKTLSAEAQKRLIEQLAMRHGGVEKDWKPLLLEEGLKYENITISAKDAQFLELRQFQVGEIARLFRMAPYMIGAPSQDSETYANVEQRSLHHVQYTLRAWIIRWEQEINRKLFSTRERGKFFVKFNIDAFLRGDLKGRSEAMKIQIDAGIMTINEGRALEDRNPVAGGDEISKPKPADPAPTGKKPDPEEDAPAPAVKALAPVLRDALERISRREAKAFAGAAKRAAETGFLSGFHEWAFVFYAGGHRDYVKTALAPVFEAARIAAGVPVEARDWALEQMVRRWNDHSSSGMARLVAEEASQRDPGARLADPEFMGRHVRAVLEQFSTETWLAWLRPEPEKEKAA